MIKIKKVREILEKKNTHQLKEYAYHNMQLKKADLIEELEVAGEKVNHRLTYEEIVKQHREAVIEIIIELWESCD